MIQHRRFHALLVLFLCLASVACSTGNTKAPAGQSKGAELYTSNCAQCHGKDGTGGFMNLGPSLKGIASFWDSERLLEYIADPRAYSAKVERLGKREMTAVADSVTPDERQWLVEHALSLMD